MDMQVFKWAELNENGRVLCHGTTTHAYELVYVMAGKTHIAQAEYMAMMEKQTMHESAENCREPFQIFDS